MGKKGGEIVNVGFEELLNVLYKAYADEWVTYHYYKRAATVVSGIESPNVVRELVRKAEEEEHADELAVRILELDGESERDSEDLQKIANCTQIVFPENVSDLIS